MWTAWQPSTDVNEVLDDIRKRLANMLTELTTGELPRWDRGVAKEVKYMIWQ